MEAAAILDGGVQVDGESAIGADSARGEQVACRVAHLHGGAGFAAAGQLGASQAYHQVHRCIRRRGVTAIDQGRGDVGCRRRIACRVGGAHGQGLASGLRGL